ncbi:MAG: hypothetical protein K8S98_14755 [Planctomycetes bacterium]|nr:hypothetical protein [Planctomycetota bacterium]
MLSPAASPAARAATPWKPRVLAVLFGTVAALFAFVLTMQNRSFGAHASVGFENKTDDLAALLAERNRAMMADVGLSELLPWRLSVPERIAKKLFPLSNTTQIYDEYSYFRHKSNMTYANEWPEHPKGRWYVRTNSIGFREDAETPREKQDLRIVITGDSHTDGACDNAETFPNLLEGALSERHPGKTIDVVNAGKGGFSFYNYLGMLERVESLDLKPDVFVVTVYGGNDFQEVLMPWHFFAGVPRSGGAPTYWDKVEAAKHVNEACLSQGILAVKYFQYAPDELERALQSALGLSGQIVGECRARGIVPVFAYLPSWYELDADRTMEEFGAVLDVMELKRADIERVIVLADRYLAGLRALGAQVIDLRPVFQAERGDLYWKHDHHINLLGHQRVAAALLEPLEALTLQHP